MPRAQLILKVVGRAARTSPLSEIGRSQAGQLRSRLEREHHTPTRIYTSPLSRAKETARIAAGKWEHLIESWDDLVEIDVGVFAGLTPTEVDERFPDIARSFAAARNFDLVEGAETYDERTTRAQRIVDGLINEHGNMDRVLVFTHGGILAHIIDRLLGTDRLWGIGIRNTGIFEFSIDVDSWHLQGQPRTNIELWRIIKFNDASHLD